MVQPQLVTVMLPCLDSLAQPTKLNSLGFSHNTLCAVGEDYVSWVCEFTQRFS